jgi:hypothetical protein
MEAEAHMFAGVEDRINGALCPGFQSFFLNGQLREIIDFGSNSPLGLQFTAATALNRLFYLLLEMSIISDVCLIGRTNFTTELSVFGVVRN